MAPVIDTSATTEIHAAPGKLALLTAGCFGFVALGGAIIAAGSGSGFPAARLDDLFKQVIGASSIIFFGGCALIAMWRLVTMGRGLILTMSPAGLSDVRVSPDTIPWTAVERIFEWSHSGSKIMIVRLRPGEEDKLRLTPIVKMTRTANARLGADGLAINASDLTIRHADLMAMANAYAERYGVPMPSDSAVRDGL